MAAMECLLSAWFLSALPLGLESNSDFTITPGLHTTSGDGQAVSLQWELGDNVDLDEVFMLHNDMCVIHKVFLSKSDCSGNSLDTSVRDIEVADRSINHIIHSVHRKDAGYYTCNIKYGTAANYTDSNAVIYVFGKPDKAKVTPLGPSHEGSQITLHCQADSTSLPVANRSQVNMVYTWRNNSADLDPGDLPERYSITSSGDPANAVNDTLTIKGLSRHDAGSYTCYGHEEGSTLLSDISNSYMLIPLYAPGIASPGGNKTVNTDDDVTLNCFADDPGRPEGSWIWTTPGGAEINTSDAEQLTIYEATVMRDDGEYSCRLNNHVGDGTRAYVTVTVQDMPSVEVIEDVSLQNIELLNVSCKAKARPQCDVSWKYANGSSLPSSVFTWTNSSEPVGKYTDTTSYLQWTVDSSPDDRRHEGGDITCVASNVVDDTTTDFMLDVQFAPYNVQVKPSADIIEYESLGPVLCSAVCNPPCTYSWYKGDVQVSSNATLMIHNVTRDDHGMYKCRPDNTITGGRTADFYLTVFYGPSIHTFEAIPPSQPINQHDNVTFSCKTDSRPMPVIALVRPSGDTLVSSSTSNILEHPLTDINCLDSGSYKCVANNSRTGWSDHMPLAISVQCPPRKFSTSGVRVGATEGDAVTFSITAIASPQPTFTWFFNGTELPDLSYFTMTSYSVEHVPEVYVNSSLTLSNVTQVDFGNYSVTARNLLGVMEEVVYSLTPSGPPVTPSQLTASHSNAVSITMQWTSGWNRGGEQVFTLMYRRSVSDDSYTNITDISDPGQGETITAKARNLASDSSYDFIVVADNQYGSTQSQLVSVATTVQPDLESENDGGLSIVISGDMATITWSLHIYSGPITHVDVNSCVSDSTNCILTTTVPPITSTVEVAVSEGGSSYTFEFRVYDGEDVILGLKYVIKVDGGSSVGIIVGVLVAVLVLIVVAGVVTFDICRRKSQADVRKGQTNASELGHVNPLMVTDNDISPSANGKHDSMSEGHQMVVENTLYASSGSGRDDHMHQPYAEVPVVTGNRMTGAKAPGKKNKPKGKKGKLPMEDTFSPYEDVDGTDKPNDAGPVDSLLPEYAEVDRSQKPKKAKKTKKAEVVEYEEVDFKKKLTGAHAAAAGPGDAMGAAALPEYGQVDFSKKHKQGKAAKPPQLEEYAQVNFSKKNKKESEAAGKDNPPVKGKKPKPGAPPPRPPRAASVDEGERAQCPTDHQPQYGVEGTLYADLDLINTRPTCGEPTVHANLEPSEYASIDALRLTTRPADQ